MTKKKKDPISSSILCHFYNEIGMKGDCVIISLIFEVNTNRYLVSVWDVISRFKFSRGGSVTQGFGLISGVYIPH